MALPPNRLFCSSCGCARAVTDFPFDQRGFCRATCMVCKSQRDARRARIKAQKDRNQKNSPKQPQNRPLPKLLPKLDSRYCSGCNQSRLLSQFGTFYTCCICRVGYYYTAFTISFLSFIYIGTKSPTFTTSLTSIRRQGELTTPARATPTTVARGSRRGRTKITAKSRPNYRGLPLRRRSK